MTVLEKAHREWMREEEARKRAAAALIIESGSIDWSRFELPVDDQARVRRASEYADEVVASFADNGDACGARLPWGKTHGTIRLRPGEMSIWAGVNGHGKSMLLSHVILDLMTQGERACIASLEMRPVSTLKRMARQAVGVESPAEEWARRFLAWLGGKLWLYDQQGTVSARRMVALVRYCREEIGIQHVVVDSLMKCGIGVDDYNAQKAFVDQLATLANQAGVHVHLVAHSRKKNSEHDMMDKFDVKGSSEITDMADNVFSLWRNKRKEELRQAGKLERQDEPDAFLTCDKQRHGEWEGRIALWYHPGAQQFLARDVDQPIDYMGRSAE